LPVRHFPQVSRGIRCVCLTYGYRLSLGELLGDMVLGLFDWFMPRCGQCGQPVDASTYWRQRNVRGLAYPARKADGTRQMIPVAWLCGSCERRIPGILRGEYDDQYIDVPQELIQSREVPAGPRGGAGRGSRPDSRPKAEEPGASEAGPAPAGSNPPPAGRGARPHQAPPRHRPRPAEAAPAADGPAPETTTPPSRRRPPPPPPAAPTGPPPLVIQHKVSHQVLLRVPSGSMAGGDFRGAKLHRALMRGMDLRGTNLSGADLTGASLRHANFTGADLSGADLRNANLTGATLTGTKLLGAVWNDETEWPEGFDAGAHGMRQVKERAPGRTARQRRDSG
jgi:hypothetical protein